MMDKREQIEVGWNEWCALPQLKIPYIKCKIDTGARTSSLHAYHIQKVRKFGKEFVKFSIHPIQNNDLISYVKEAEILDERNVMSSNGQKERRFFISTLLQLSGQSWPIELTLSNRCPLKFRLLLGREALAHRVVIDPSKQCLLGSISKKKLMSYYQTRP